MIQNAPKDAAVYSVDLDKNVFHGGGLYDRGAAIQRVKLRRETLLAFFERVARIVVGMEAYPVSQTRSLLGRMLSDPRAIHRIDICAIAALAISQGAHAQGTPPADSPTAPVSIPSDDDVASPEGLPVIGKWMLAKDGRPSDWLGELYRGKNLREPINVIIVDDDAKDLADAVTRILGASTSVGYPVRMGHSVGYQALIGGFLHTQLPIGRDDAFSDAPFEISNNHGRIFGPFAMGGSYVFIAAFSREEVNPFGEPHHRYGSFNRARDDFTQRLDGGTAYKVTGFVDLGNAILNDPKLTTVEHDGLAVMVRATP